MSDDAETPGERIYRETGGATPALRAMHAEFGSNVQHLDDNARLRVRLRAQMALQDRLMDALGRWMEKAMAPLPEFLAADAAWRAEAAAIKAELAALAAPPASGST